MFRCSRAANSVVGGQIWPKFKLVRDFMHVLVTCKYKKDWINLFVCLCWGLMSQSTIFQSCRDGATASWVINQYFRGVKCLAQGHNTAVVGFEPWTSRSGVRHSTTEPPCSLDWIKNNRKGGDIVFPIISQWELSVALETRVLIAMIAHLSPVCKCGLFSKLRSQWSNLAEIWTRPRFYACPCTCK